MKKHVFLALVATGFTVFVNGCASIVSGSEQTVQLNSIPSGANIQVQNQYGQIIYTGKTPAVVNLETGSSFKSRSYKIVTEKPGYEKNVQPLNAGLNNWVCGNVCFLGLIGGLVDFASGAAWELPETATINLEAR